VVYTKSRQEKALARHLVTHHVPFYLPLVKQKRQTRGRRVTSQLPLFTGYLFMHCSAEERVTALTSNRISQILDVEDQATLLRDLQQVKRLIGADAPLTIEQRLEAGRKVRVKSGALAGLEGTIVARRSDSRLLIAVNYLNQGVSIQIEDFMVEPI
jgi:transcriptional antiterminator RfaH